jgi:hypothetical protein
VFKIYLRVFKILFKGVQHLYKWVYKCCWSWSKFNKSYSYNLEFYSHVNTQHTHAKYLKESLTKCYSMMNLYNQHHTIIQHSNCLSMENHQKTTFTSQANNNPLPKPSKTHNNRLSMANPSIHYTIVSYIRPTQKPLSNHHKAISNPEKSG